MIEIVFNAPSKAALVQAATTMGFYDAKTKSITPAGVLAAGGNWHFNLVGTVYQPTGATQKDAFGNDQPVMAALPGLWGRLRHNGDPANLPQVPAGSGIALYRLVTPADGGPSFWSSDGTSAPDYVGAIGVML